MNEDSIRGPLAPGREKVEEQIDADRRFYDALKKLAVESGKADLLRYVDEQKRALSRLEYELEIYGGRR